MCCELPGDIWDLKNIRCGIASTIGNDKHHKPAFISLLSPSLPPSHSFHPLSFLLPFGPLSSFTILFWFSAVQLSCAPLGWNCGQSTLFRNTLSLGPLFYSFNFLSRQEAKVGVSYYGPCLWIMIVSLKQTGVLLLNKTIKLVILSFFLIHLKTCLLQAQHN